MLEEPDNDRRRNEGSVLPEEHSVNETKRMYSRNKNGMGSRSQ